MPVRVSFQRWLLVPLGAVIAMALATFAGRDVDGALFRGFVHGLANPPFFIEEVSDSSTAAFRLRTLASHAAKSSRPAEWVVVALEDDPDGIFQSFPHAPVDVALVLRNMERHGAKRVAVGAVMAWENPDPFGLIALNNSLDRFDEVVTSVPLTRGATAEPLPAAFRRASLAPEVVVGDLTALPVVNRPAIADAVLGNDNSLAGFTSIEPSTRPEQPPLLARWDDRVVLAFPLLAALQQRGGGHDDLEIRLGSHIRAGGAAGWVIPIDSSGRLAVPAASADDGRVIPAGVFFERDFEPGDEGETLPEAWLLRDDRSTIERVFRGHSTRLVPVVAAITEEAGLGESRVFHRLPFSANLMVMAGWVLLLSALGRIGGFAMDVGVVAGVAGWAFLQWTGFALASVWLPGVPALAAAVVAWLVAKTSRQAAGPARVDIPSPVVESDATDHPDQPKESEVLTAVEEKTTTRKTAAKKTTARKAAKKTTARKTAAATGSSAKKTTAKKTTAKKTTAKKAARKRATRKAPEDETDQG